MIWLISYGLIVVAVVLMVATLLLIWLSQEFRFAYRAPAELVAVVTIFVVLAYAIGQAGFALRHAGGAPHGLWTHRLHSWLGSTILFLLFLIALAFLAKPGWTRAREYQDDVSYAALSFWINTRLQEIPRAGDQQFHTSIDDGDLPPGVLGRLQGRFPALTFVSPSEWPHQEAPYVLGTAQEVDSRVMLKSVDFPFWNVASLRVVIGACAGHMTLVKVGSRWHTTGAFLESCM